MALNPVINIFLGTLFAAGMNFLVFAEVTEGEVAEVAGICFRLNDLVADVHQGI